MNETNMDGGNLKFIGDRVEDMILKRLIFEEFSGRKTRSVAYMILRLNLRPEAILKLLNITKAELAEEILLIEKTLYRGDSSEKRVN